MIEPRPFPFGGVPVYNPQSLSRAEALAQFHARQTAYQSLIDLLREERPSHVLIIGTRGMGKTTLLQRVRYGVEDDVELNGQYLALVFPEEQYNVSRLHYFLLNTLDALADAMERLHNERMLKRVEEYAEKIGKLGQEEIEKEVPKFLAEIGQEVGRNLLLLVDNADRLFETIEIQEQWRLRELLSSRSDLTLFGATTQASDGIYGADRAFFEFFKIYRLAPLSLEEVRDLLLQLSESVEEEEGEKGSAKRRVEEWLAADASRLRTLVQLTGGNPRTTVLLFHLVLDGLSGGAREYLEQLLDQCTPNYKGRVDELPPQAQQVFDAVSLRWDPVTASEVAEDTGLETSAVSTQLTRLVRQGLLEKADPGDSKKALYQVAERFFNIWYLMRASRRVRAKLRWFVEFLRVFFDSGELEKMAWERLEGFRSARRMRPTEIETVFAYAFASGADRSKFEDYLRRECADREEEWRPFLDLPGIPERVSLTEERGSGLENSNEIHALRKAVEIAPGNAESWRRLAVSLAARRELTEAESAVRKAIELDSLAAQSWQFLGIFLGMTGQRTEEARAAARKAIELDPSAAESWLLLGRLLVMTPKRSDEAEIACRKTIELNPDFALAWNLLGDVLRGFPERTVEAEGAYRKAIALEPANAVFWNDLGKFLGKIPEREDESEAAHRKAIEIEPDSALSWNWLGNVVARNPERLAEAEAAYRKAIKLSEDEGGYWSNLGNVLRRMPERRQEAEAAHRHATKLGPKDARFWVNLGSLLEEMPDREADAETAYRKAIELEPGEDSAWAGLGDLLSRMPQRREEAALALRSAVDLNPRKAYWWVLLGNALSGMPDRRADAETAFRRALTIDPTSGDLWGIWGVFLACWGGRAREAENAFRKSEELRPDFASNLRNLGVLLYCEMNEDREAVFYLRRAAQLNPSDPVSSAILAACLHEVEPVDKVLPLLREWIGRVEFWDELLGLGTNYAPFGRILLGVCDLVREIDRENSTVRLHRAVALAQLGDFPRASVAFEDALVGDPIEKLSVGRKAIEVFLAAAVRHGRVQECLELLDRKDWKDAWRPIYEALKAVKEGSSEYLKRVAVEIRDPAMVILRRISPELGGLN